MLYILLSYGAVCQLHLSKTEWKKRKEAETTVNLSLWHGFPAFPQMALANLLPCMLPPPTERHALVPAAIGDFIYTYLDLLLCLYIPAI